MREAAELALPAEKCIWHAALVMCFLGFQSD